MAAEKVTEIKVGEPEVEPPKKHEKSSTCCDLIVLIILLGIGVFLYQSITDSPYTITTDVATKGDCPSRSTISVQINSTITVNAFGFMAMQDTSGANDELDFLNRTVKEQLMQLDTVIVDCPVNDSRVDMFIEVELIDYLANIRAYATENNRSTPMKVWLRLNAEAEKDYNYYISTCAEMAEVGKIQYPEIMEGVVGNTDLLELPAVTKWFESRGEINTASKLRQDLNVSSNLEDYTKKIDSFHMRDLKFAFMMDPKDCFIFPTIVPETIISEFDELFYYFKDGRTYFTIIDNIPVTVSSNNFEECKDFVAAKAPGAPQVKSIKSPGYMSYANFLRIFSGDEIKDNE